MKNYSRVLDLIIGVGFQFQEPLYTWIMNIEWPNAVTQGNIYEYATGGE